MQALSDLHVGAEKLYILDFRGCLAPASDLVYNDAPWVPDQQSRFVHPKLSNEVLLNNSPSCACHSAFEREHGQCCIMCHEVYSDAHVC